MTFADTLAVAAAAGAFLGGFCGSLVTFSRFSEWIDNAQRGAFVGAYFTTLLGAIVGA
ncbi:MAG: hypothetical protein M3320_06295 [Actinomycetota bacterium]|nr:hypothetical protein [Actinomycetota bacterium]